MVDTALLQSLNKPINPPLVQADGYALLWAYEGDVQPFVQQTLEDYGGIRSLYSEGQEIWFFFSTDVVLAAAKLYVWSQFNPLPGVVQVFRASLAVSDHLTFQLMCDASIWKQKFEISDRFHLYVNAGVFGGTAPLPGITLKKVDIPAGFAPGGWFGLNADQRLPYKPGLGWFCVLHPVGSRQDKRFQSSWREFYSRLESILQRNQLRYTLHDNFLLIPFDTLRQMKTWCKDYLNLVDKLKDDPESIGFYWPCVQAIVNKRGYSFNTDLPAQTGLDWDNLMPDYPHMALRDGLLLGPRFRVHELKIGGEGNKLDMLCNVSLHYEDQPAGSLPNLSSSALFHGKNQYCFYCGQRSHASRECPSKKMDKSDSAVWRSIAMHGYNELKSAMDELGNAYDGSMDSLNTLLGGSGLGHDVLQGIFSINETVQLRGVRAFWRVRSSDYPQALLKPGLEDSSPVWDILHSMYMKDSATLSQELHDVQVRFPTDYRVFSLLGFLSMEQGDLDAAEQAWDQAYLLSNLSLIQAWHLFLKARLAEYRGQYLAAIAQYAKIQEQFPAWIEAVYRIFVCRVKSGFIGQARSMIADIVRRDPHYFNKMLFDPELERGTVQVLGALFSLWNAMSATMEEEQNNLDSLKSDLHEWFVPENSFLIEAEKRLDTLRERSEIDNFVPCMSVITGRAAFERDMQARITKDGHAIKQRFNSFLMRLAAIRDEAAWFPFPKLLSDFNRDYNRCAANINWVIRGNMRVPEVFRKAQEFADKEDERISNMEKRLKLLRVIRDGTLFSLVVIKKFLWMEIVGLALILAIFPLLLYYGDRSNFFFFSDSLSDADQWELQKSAIFSVTMAALFIAGLWSALRFERIREKTFAKAKAMEVKNAQERARNMEQARRKKRVAIQPSKKAKN